MMMNWSWELEKQFGTALRRFPEGYPNRWETIAELIGATKEMVCQRYQELLHAVAEIEISVQIPPPPPDYLDSWPHSSAAAAAAVNQAPKYRGPIRNKEIRHVYGKGKWKDISELLVKTRNAVQVASHAQKFYTRQSHQRRTNVKRRRSSIHDVTLADIDSEYLNQIVSSLPPPRHHKSNRSSSSSVHHHYHHHQAPYSLPVMNQSSHLQSNNPSSSILHPHHHHQLPSSSHLHQSHQHHQVPSSGHHHHHQVHYSDHLPLMHQSSSSSSSSSVLMSQPYPQVPYQSLPMNQWHQYIIYSLTQVVPYNIILPL